MSWDVTDLQASHLTWNILYNIVLHLFTALILSFGKRRIFRLHVSHQTGVQITTTWLTAALFSLRIRTAVCRMRFRGSNRYCVRPFSDLRGVYKGNMASILSPVSVKTNHHKDGPLDGLEKKKKKTLKASFCIATAACLSAGFWCGWMCQGHSQEVSTPLAMDPIVHWRPPSVLLRHASLLHYEA